MSFQLILVFLKIIVVAVSKFGIRCSDVVIGSDLYRSETHDILQNAEKKMQSGFNF